MVTQFVAELKATISEPRLERYRRPVNASDLEMLINYFWNMALADALHCSLSAAEVLLRNTIHSTLSAYIGQEDWYERDELLEGRQREDRDDAKHNIETRGREITPERVVSKLTFGFWVTLLSKTYNERFWRPDLSDRPNLRIAFPYSPAKHRRSDIQAKYYRANNLRNLAFHHEPIFDLRSLEDDYRRTYEGIGWIDTTMPAKIQIFDRFPDIHANGRDAVEAQLRRYLGI